MKLKKVLLICLIIIIIIIIILLRYRMFYNEMYNNFSSIDTITSWDSGGFGGYPPYYISIDQEGKVTIESFSKEEIKEQYESYIERHPDSVSSFDSYYNSFINNEPYYYKVEYQIDKALVDDLNKTVKENFLAFFQNAKPGKGILDGASYRIYVKLNNGSEYSNGGYEPQNEKFNIIKDKIFKCITAEDNGEKYYNYLHELDLKFDQY